MPYTWHTTSTTPTTATNTTRVTISARAIMVVVGIALAMLGVGVSSATAADVSGLITSVTKTTTGDHYTLHKRVSLTMSWDAGAVDLKAGDTMSLALDSSLGCDTAPNMLAPDGAVVATGACSAGVVTWTFTGWVVSHPLNRHGGADFTVVTVAADDEVSVTWDDTTTVLPFTIVTPGGGRGYAKWALDDHWRVRFGSPLKPGTISFTESLGECQTLDHVVWVKGSGTFDAATMTGTTTWDGEHTPILDIYVTTTCLPDDHTYRNAVIANGKTRSATAEAGAGAWGTGASATSTTSSSSTTSTTTAPTTSSSTTTEPTWTTTTPPTTTTSSSNTSSPTSSHSTTATTASGTTGSTRPPTTSARPTGSGSLPVTGADLRLGLLGLVLIVLGTVLAVVTRPRGRYTR